MRIVQSEMDLLIVQLHQQCADALRVFHSGSDFETAVEVDAGPLGMVEGLKLAGAVGMETSTQQERCLTVVVLQQAPVEGLA